MSNVKLQLSFRDISEAIHGFEFPEVDHVIGIATGGLFPAILIAHQLNVDFNFIHIHFRDPANNPVYSEPKILLNPVKKLAKSTRILLVDEVSVSGKTMEKARELLNDYHVSTCVLKGKGDYVIFPDIRSCVIWPWKVEG
jgi:hypoxanthine phosphoribosyltransferase